MRYRFLLFDADNTILDFDKSEAFALCCALEKFGVEYTEEILSVYKRNNLKMWELLEECKVSKEQVLIGRFELTAEELNLSVDVNALAAEYERMLHKAYYVIDGAESLLSKLICDGFKLYLVSNGVLSIQNSRMKGSGLDRYFIKRFISEEIGYPKPQIKYFEYCFAHIDGFDKESTLIIGDSLTSDIRGGINAGIDTCWFNPHQAENRLNLPVTYQISNLQELLKIVY